MGSAPFLLFTNTVSGDSSYERQLWEGVVEAAEAARVPLVAIAGGQLVPGTDGQLKLPPLFRVARQFEARAALINGGTIQQGVSIDDLAGFVRGLPGAAKMVTALPVPGLPTTVVDNLAGMRAIADHVVKTLGRRQPIYMSGPLSNPEAAERLQAFRNACSEAGLEVGPDRIFEGTWMGPSAVAHLKKVFDRGLAFDAVVCANDLMALGVLEELQARKVSVPGEVVVTGFDDVEAARVSFPPLSTVYQPIAGMGAESIQELVAAEAQGRTPRAGRVAARMVLRSSAPASRSAGATEASVGASTSSPGGAGWQASLRAFVAGLAPAPWLAETLGLLGSEGDQGQLNARLVRQMELAAADDLDQVPRTVEALRRQWLPTLGRVEDWAAVTPALFALVEAHRSFVSADSYQRERRNEALMAALVQVNRQLNQVGRLQDLEKTMAEAFQAGGVRACRLVLTDGDDQARLLVSVTGGRPAGTPAQGVAFDLAQIVPQGFGQGRTWVLLPLTFEDQFLGYLALERSDIPAFVYESLANLTASVLHSLFLIEKIEVAEAAAARRADSIGDLVRPMISELQAAGHQARGQSEVMAALASTNKETSGKLAGMDDRVRRIREALARVLDLIGTIEEVSETISVIAINAAIAAARAGSDGKVFGVISSEIRKLADQTKANTTQISGVLGELGQTATDFFDASSQTRQVFTRLEGEIGRLLESLGQIQGALSSLDGRAQQVLETMAGS